MDRGPTSGAVVRVVTIVIAAGLLLYAAYQIRHILVLAIISMFLAIGLDPVVRTLNKIHLKRSQAVALVFLGLVVFVTGFVASVTPPLIRQTQKLVRELPDYVEHLSDRSERFQALDERYDLTKNLRSQVGNIGQVAARSAGSAVGVLQGVASRLFNLLTVMILTIYFLLDLPQLRTGANRLVPMSKRKRFEELSDVVFDRISGYMIGQLTVSLIAGGTSLVALTLLKVPFSLPLAMWVAVASLIPMVGATLGAVAAVVVAFFSSTAIGVGTVIFFVIYQQVENYVIAPRVMKKAVNISAAAVILSALIGATLLGFVGALLAIPVAASLKVITREVWMPRQDAS